MAATLTTNETVGLVVAGLSNTPDTNHQARAVEAYLLQRMLEHVEVGEALAADRRQAEADRRKSERADSVDRRYLGVDRRKA